MVRSISLRKFAIRIIQSGMPSPIGEIMALDLKLTGKKVLITGASEGIGRAIAERMGAEGCHLYLAARSEKNLAAVRDGILAKSKVTVRVFPLDLSLSASHKILAESCADADILVNNAGSTPNGRIASIDEATLRKAFDLKIFGYFNLCRAFYGYMSSRRSGVIVNIIGTGGERPVANYVAGGMGNAAVMALTRALGGDSHKDGVRVVGINPGPVATERVVKMFKKEARDRFNDESRHGEFVKDLPFGRPATVEEIADMTAFLASDLSAYTTGTIVTIDGGMIYGGTLF
jgi:NAD(P)-dependent dehydrogenase (short-subunit alcohol dehydrogenase family)